VGPSSKLVPGTVPEPRSHGSVPDGDAIDWDASTRALNRWGVVHVAPGSDDDGARPRTVAELFERLALAGDPRLNQAMVFLLLTHPDLAPNARAAIDRLDGATRDRATRRHVAAATLQRMARTRISLRLGPQPMVPPAYLEELGLPPLDDEFGRVTLLALAEEETRRYGYDAWRTYLNVLDLFLVEIRRRDWGVPCDIVRTGSV
jgi:hypothetical protein